MQLLPPSSSPGAPPDQRHGASPATCSSYLVELQLSECILINLENEPRISPQRLIASVFNRLQVAGCHFLPHAAPLNGALHVEAIPKSRKSC